MLKDKYVVRAWTADWDCYRYGYSSVIFEGTKQECLEFCKKQFIDAAIKLANNDGYKEYDLSLGWDPEGGSMRVTEISLYGRNAYDGMHYTRYYAIENALYVD